MLLSLCAAMPLLADSQEQRGRERYQERRNSEYVDLDRAVSRVRDRTGGRILSAKTKRSDGRPVHVIRVMTENGKVRRIRVDAGSGQPVK